MISKIKKIVISIIDKAIDRHLKQSENAIRFAKDFIQD